MYDGVFEIDDEEEEDSDAFIEQEVASIARGLKNQIWRISENNLIKFD